MNPSDTLQALVKSDVSASQEAVEAIPIPDVKESLATLHKDIAAKLRKVDVSDKKAAATAKKLTKEYASKVRAAVLEYSAALTTNSIKPDTAKPKKAKPVKPTPPKRYLYKFEESHKNEEDTVGIFIVMEGAELAQFKYLLDNEVELPVEGFDNINSSNTSFITDDQDFINKMEKYGATIGFDPRYLFMLHHSDSDDEDEHTVALKALEPYYVSETNPIPLKKK